MINTHENDTLCTSFPKAMGTRFLTTRTSDHASVSPSGQCTWTAVKISTNGTGHGWPDRQTERQTDPALLFHTLLEISE